MRYVRLVGVVMATMSHDVFAQARDVRAVGRTLDVGEARINYVVAGTGPAVVLLHGWALDLREWHDQIAALSVRYRVIAVDRRGFGKSTGFADLSADPGDLRALLDSLGIRSAVLVGHSDGVEAAYRFTAAMPERVDGLVLYGGRAPVGFPIPPTEPPGPPFATLALIARRYGVDSVMRAFTARPQFQPGPHRSPAVLVTLDSIRRDYSGRDLLEDHSPSGRFPMAQFDAVKQWRMPTLFISGERETPRWHLVADSLARWMPNARKVVVPGGGHAVHFDEPERFNRTLLDFLAEVERSAKARSPRVDDGPAVSDPADPDIKLLTQLQIGIAAAIAPLDSIALDSLIAPDVRMINAGDQVFQKNDIVRYLRANGGPLVRVVDDSMAVRRYGDVALMTLRETVTVRINGTESTGRLRITEVWFRRAGRWQVVGGQSTALP